jgi:trimethylamine--corrinoid protein Co-methyltransferase
MTEGSDRAVMRARVLDDAGCRRVHAASLRVLAEAGVEVRHEGALELLRGAGARVEDTRARFPAGLVERALATVPASRPLKGRAADGSLDIVLEEGVVSFGSGPDCLYVAEPGSGERRRARLDDVEAFAALAERLPNIDFVMSMGLPEDAANEVVDLAQFAAMLAGTRKPIVVSSPFDGASLRVMAEMARLCGCAGSLACLTMSSPPLSLDQTALDKILVCAELQAPVILATSPSIGSTAPASTAAAAIVANAEVLAGLVVHQSARAGAPFLYGVGIGMLNMRTMIEPYLSPAVVVGDQMGADLASHYGMPSWSYAACSDAKLLDEQAAAEYGIATALGAISGSTLLHDVGYLESGLQSSYEGLVLGDELAGYARALVAAVSLGDDDLAVDEILQAGPGGNHLGRPMTRRRYRDFWQPRLLDQAPHEAWRSAGSPTLFDRVKERTAGLLAEPRTFRLDAATRERLAELVRTGVPARRP